MTEAAFANPAIDAARAFRQILDATARPGRPLAFAPPVVPPAGLSRESAALALTLCDFQTPLWLAPELRTPAVERYLRFHTGAPIVTEPAEATFVFAHASRPLPDLQLLRRGNHEYPDRSATLAIEVAALNETDATVELSGPGLETPRRFGAPPLGAAFWSGMIALRDDFPLGVDVILLAPGVIAAVPRSTLIAYLETI